MASRPCPSPSRDAQPLELVLRDEDGAPWVLSIAPGMARFIGSYPRLDGFGGDSPLLLFRPADADA